MSGDTTSSDTTSVQAFGSVDMIVDTKVTGPISSVRTSSVRTSSLKTSSLKTSSVSSTTFGTTSFRSTLSSTHRGSDDRGGTQVISKYSSSGLVATARGVAGCAHNAFSGRRDPACDVPAVDLPEAALYCSSLRHRTGNDSGKSSWGGMLVDRTRVAGLRRRGMQRRGIGQHHNHECRNHEDCNHEFEIIVRSGECRSPHDGSTPR
jgi:hypothetical protein